MEILNITTPRLTIRNLKLSDLNDFHIYRSNPDVTKYQGFEVMTIDQAEEFLKEKLLIEYYDDVLLDGIRLAEVDARKGLLEEDRAVRTRSRHGRRSRRIRRGA